MRVAYSYPRCEDPSRFRNSLDTTVDDFGESLREKELISRIVTRSDYRAAFAGEFWVADFRRVLSQVLDKNRRVLSIGSCFGENEAPFIESGYDIVCSDINANVIKHMQKLFGEDRFCVLNIFEPELSDNNFEDFLVTGLDYAFDDEKALAIFKNCRRLITESTAAHKRLLFTLRYNDNFATRFLDEVILPLESGMKNSLMSILGRPTRFIKKQHGFRRSRREIVAMARQAGFKLVNQYHGGFGVELSRSSLFSKVPGLRPLVRKIDERWNLLNNVTLYDFTLA